MADTARAPRRPRFICMALNSAGRPVPMFDPFLGDAPGSEVDMLDVAGEIEGLLFGERPGAVTALGNGKGAA
ncbi:hypothetical protein LAC81_09310 [Ensifer adhaerens]|uniref:hypothetical protein n=1 Tax=Ensifer adhaerens TaxID=106592 RepID=UPI001CC1A890|nr:hypothetical protein [Ensifer adhaerens]MBZ7921980.1 hypothetical protein [Ensifer adhaerens]UAX94372.1 hypothetical protein LAC78_09305 [Ensifer adhaerens]UAY02007.1 hypothetical protein LAC80_09315 [Ensifer adhaerens]UAY09390.1 hypothetical protein LAC81_09310 [Ensifer adhaerens]